jgi:thioredoxin 1
MSLPTGPPGSHFVPRCGPCKAISPTFEALATSHAAPGRVAFAKVDVDEVQEVAKKYGVTA